MTAEQLLYSEQIFIHEPAEDLQHAHKLKHTSCSHSKHKHTDKYICSSSLFCRFWNWQLSFSYYYICDSQFSEKSSFCRALRERRHLEPSLQDGRVNLSLHTGMFTLTHRQSSSKAENLTSTKTLDKWVKFGNWINGFYWVESLYNSAALLEEL